MREIQTKSLIERPWLVLSLVLLGALVVRLVVFWRTPVIAEDSFFYIYHAQKILAGAWEEALRCRYKFIPFSSLSIIPFYELVGDWILAGQMSSVFWTLAGTVPLYLLSRQLFSARVALLMAVAYAFLPFFVKRSLDVLKGPPFWFFSLMGFYLVGRFGQEKRPFWLSLASISFLLASSSRIEALIYLPGTFLFIPFLCRGQGCSPSKALLFFALPPLVVLGLFFLPLFSNKEGTFSLYHLYFERRIGLINYQSNYHQWYSQFDTLARKTGAPLWKYLRETLWILPLEILVYKIFSAISGLGPIFCLGMARAKSRLREPLVAYLSFLSALAFLLLLFWAYKFPAITKRYVIVFVLPAYVFVGLGLDWLLDRWPKRQKKVFVFLLILLLSFPLVDIHKLRRKNKIPFLKAARVINRLERHHRPVKIATTSWYILFYVNYFRRPAICYLSMVNYRHLTSNPQNLPQILRQEKVAYFVWEEKTLGRRGEAIRAVADKYLQPLGVFPDSSLGTIILYRIPPKEASRPDEASLPPRLSGERPGRP